MTILSTFALVAALGSPSFACRERATAELLARHDPVTVAVLGSPLGVSSPDAEVRWRAAAILRVHAATQPSTCWACGGTGWDAGRSDAEVAGLMERAGMQRGSGVPCQACRGKGKPGP